MKKSRLLVMLFLFLAITIAGCTRSPEQRKARHLAAGKEFYNKKDYVRAILQFKNAVKAAPADPEPYYQLSLAYIGTSDARIGTSDARMAVLSLKKALELNPKHTAAQLKMAELLANTRDRELLEEAEKRIHEVLVSSPFNEDALNVLGVTEWQLGKMEDAERHLRQALDRFPTDLKAALGLVQIKLMRHDFKGAEELLKKFAADNSKLPEPVLALGEIYVLAGKPAEAEQQFHRAFEIDPKNGLALLDLAALQFRARRMEEAERTYKQLSTLPDRQYRPVHAIFLFQTGKRDLAIAEFEKLVKADPTDRDARSRLIQAYYNTNRKADAEKVLKAVLQKNPKDVDALLQRSIVYADTGKYVDAQNDLAQVLRFKPDSAEAHYVLARVYGNTGGTSQQRQELNEAIRLAPGFLLGRLELAQLLLMAGNPKYALAVLDEAPPSQKNALVLIIQRNWVNLALDDMAEFRKGLSRASAISRGPEVLLQEAQLKFVQHDYPSARKTLEEVLLQTPEDDRALDLMVRSYLAQRQPLTTAAAKIRDHAGRHPRSAPIQYFLGKLLMAGGDRAGARQSFQTAKTADPSFIKADERLAQLDLADGKLENARRRLSGLLAPGTSTETELSVRLQLLVIEEQAENYSATIQHCRRILELDENNVKALNDLAFLLADYTNQPDEALKLAERAKRIAPENPDVADTLGWILYRKGLYEVALTHFEAATSRKGSTALPKVHLALVYFKLGKQQQGQQSLDEALKLDPSLSTTKVCQEALAQAKKKGPKQS